MKNLKIDFDSKAFVDDYTYAGEDLGCTYHKAETVLKVWAPTATAVGCGVLQNEVKTVYDMEKAEQGVWALTLKGNYELASYVYHVYFGKEMNVATDPFAVASTPNHERTVIIDSEKTKLDSHKAMLSPLKRYTDAVIYELHVRDFSVDESSGIAGKGKYLGLTEEGTVTAAGGMSGLDYLSSLGVTHIQLLPVYDFGSVDEHDQFASYNWGYDPVQYNVPEGSYSKDVSDPYSRILELKQAIAAMHKKGLRVIMDVVYNHMYDMKASAFEKIVPGYYFRTDKDGKVSNGSFCGNDLDSTRPMMRQFLLRSTKLWMEEYGFDGFRFDLMGILDIDVMNAIAEQTLAIDPSAMIYGEGWNMPTFLPDEEKATMMNHEKMPDIAHFSDIFRENIKGGTLDDKFEEGGYGSGDVEKSVNAMHLLLGTVMPVESIGNHLDAYFVEPKHTLNYVECHDNHTLWDKLKLALPEEDDATLKLRHRFITTMVLISQGIPFIHAGQEFFRTKNGEHNSYIASDEINMLRWEQKDANEDSVQYLRELIDLRKNHDCLRFDSSQDIEENTRVEILKNHCIRYQVCAGEEGLTVLINPNLEAQQFELKHAMIPVFGQDGAVKEAKAVTEVAVKPLEILVLKADV